MRPNVLLLAVLLLLGACETTRNTPTRATTPDDALLVEVSASERDKVSGARQDANRARDAHAAAKANYEKLTREHVALGHERDSAQTVVASTENSLTQVAANGDTSEVEQAQLQLDRAKTIREMQDARVVLAAKRVELAEALVKVASEHVAVTAARVDLAKVHAINTLDRPSLQKPRASDFELVVRNAEMQERVAQVRADGAMQEVEIAKSSLESFHQASGN